MWLPPPDVLASWPIPNYVNPPQRGPTLIIVESVLIGLASFFVFTRMYIRRKSIALEDLFIVLAYVLAVLLTVAVIVATTRYDWNRHIWDVHPTNLVSSRKASWIAQVLYLSSASATKIGLLLIYRRLYSRLSFRRVVDGFIVITVSYYVVFLMVLLFECRPLDYYWLLILPTSKGTCISETQHLMASSIMNVILDVCMLLIPMRMLFLLQLPRVQKIQLAFVFSVGIFVIVASAVRVYYVYYILQKTYDVTWYGYITWIWVSAEVNIGIICACFPSCRKLFVHVRESVTTFMHQKSSGGSSAATATHKDGDQNYSVEKGEIAEPV